MTMAGSNPAKLREEFGRKTEELAGIQTMLDQGFEFREADARAKAFATKYYTADIHKGAASLPPFVAEALA